MSIASTSAPNTSQRGIVEQTRRGPTSINSGQGERVADLVLGGALLLDGLRRRSLLGMAMMAGGGWLIYAGATGHFSPYAALGFVREGGSSKNGLIIERGITINAPRAEIYAYWRDFSRLPTFMRHLKSVTTTDATHSHWIVTAPMGAHVSWDAEITADRPNELIAWRSLPGSVIANHGEVRFADAPGNRGTIVTVHLTYDPPLGTVGAGLARIFIEEPNQQVDAAMRRLKAIIETGEAPTVENQPHGKLIVGKSPDVAVSA